MNTASDLTTYNFDPLTTPTTKAQCKNDGWKNFNTPTFRNQGQCIRYVRDHAHWVSGNVHYTAGGLKRHATFNMDTGNNKGEFRYSDANRDSYMVKVSVVKVSGDTAYFAGEVKQASNPAWVGQWLFAKVDDNAPDKVWGDFTNQATAENGANNMLTPASGPFNVTMGNLKVE